MTMVLPPCFGVRSPKKFSGTISNLMKLKIDLAFGPSYFGQLSLKSLETHSALERETGELKTL